MQKAWADFCRQPIPTRFGYRTQAEDGTTRHFSEQVVAANGALRRLSVDDPSLGAIYTRFFEKQAGSEEGARDAA